MIPLPGVKIESARLRLLPVSEEYAEDIRREFDSEITKYMSPPPCRSLEDALTFIRKSMESLAENRELEVAVLNKETGEFLGCAGLYDLDEETPELGIWLKKGAHGHAYGLEAMGALICWARENTDKKALKYPVDRRNHPSRRIPEYFGGSVAREYERKNGSGFMLELLEYLIPIR